MSATYEPEPVTPDFETVCVACGGRGGWWTGERRDRCGRCAGTGWEPSAAIQRLLKGAADV